MLKQDMKAFRLPHPELELSKFAPPPAPELPDAAEFDLRAIVRSLLARRWTIVGTIGLGVVVCLVVMLQITPVYNSSTLIMVGQRENKVIDAESVLSGLSTDSATIENQIQVLRSSALFERVILKHKVAAEPEYSGASGGRTWYNPISWFSPPRPRKRISADANAVDPALVKAFASHVNVVSQGRSSVIKVTFDSSDREFAAKMANAIADQYVVDQLETKFDSARRSSGWLNDRMKQLAEAVRTSERAVEQYKADNDLTDSKGGSTLATEQLSELNAQIVTARSNVAEQEAKFRQVNELYKQGSGVDSIAAVINSPLISTLRTQQAELIRKEAELGTKYGAKHPQMLALQDEKKNLDAKIEEEVKRIIRNLGNEASLARTRLKSLQESLNEIQGTANDQGHASVRLRELEREAQANRTLYENFQNKFKANEDKDQIQTADARIIQRAAVPSDPSYPNKPMMLGSTLLGSTLLGFLLALVLERLDNSFRTGNEVERDLRLSNLAVIPSLPRTRIVADTICEKPLSSYSEAVRSLFAGLQLSNVDQPPKVILVTSSVPGEGKTTLAVSLGRIAAKSGLRVMLVDGDFRHPSVGSQFSPRAPEAGLVEVLSGKRDLGSIIHRDPISPLEFLPLANPPANPADLLASQAMRKLVAILRHHYDFVVIDAAPVLPVSDSRLLSRLADKVVYAIRWDSTPREAVIQGVKLLREANADIAGTALTQADMRRHALYGYGYTSNGYGKNYARYYAE